MVAVIDPKLVALTVEPHERCVRLPGHSDRLCQI
jgi:hypothetical protein